MRSLDLGISDVRALPGLAEDPTRWDRLQKRMHQRIFLRSEGNVIKVEPPQQVSGGLVERSREVVARFNRFYAAVADAYYKRPDLRAEHLANPLLDPLLELEADHPITTPLSRLDAVLEPDGSIRVIEINSVGVCLVHMRGLMYLMRELARDGLEEDARILDGLVRSMVVDGFVRFADARLASRPKRLVVGGLAPSGWYRAKNLLFRDAFRRAGVEYVFGHPEHLEVTEHEVRIRGTRIDVLWADYFFYIAYQHTRYKDTKFPSKLGEFGQVPAQVAELLANRHFLAHLRSRRVVNISPARAFLALPKAVLSWIHRSDRPVPEEDRAFLAEHVARTYSARDRADGVIALETVAANRGEFLLKPCQYGGSHGVMLGCMTEPDAWRTKLAEIWDEPDWAVQEFRTPVKTSAGEWVSLGLPNFDGVLGGGVFFRTSPSLLINARDAGFVPAAIAG